MLSLELQIDAAIKDLRVPQDVFARLLGVSRATLGTALRGTTTLGSARGLRAWEIVRELRELRDRAHPFPISFENLATVEALLEALRNEQEVPPPDDVDWEIVKATAIKESPFDTAARLGVTEQEFHDRAKLTALRLSYVTRAIAKAARGEETTHQ